MIVQTRTAGHHPRPFQYPNISVSYLNRIGSISLIVGPSRLNFSFLRLYMDNISYHTSNRSCLVYLLEQIRYKYYVSSSYNLFTKRTTLCDPIIVVYPRIYGRRLENNNNGCSLRMITKQRTTTMKQRMNLRRWEIFFMC